MNSAHASVAASQSPVVGNEGVPLSTADSFTPRELAAWRGLLEVHAYVLHELDVQMRTAHGLTLSQSEVLILLDDAPDQRVRMAELAKAVLLSSSGGTRLVERLETVGYVTRRAATDDRRGLFAELTETGRQVVRAARATYREGVRSVFLHRLRAADQVALSVISTRFSGGRV
jgi:DNA-binding MarR family transcriptional regulator